MIFETIVIQIDTVCPFSCPQCYIENSGKIMDSKIAYNIVDEASRQHVKMIQITGGEPLLCNYLCDFIEKCSKKKLLTAVATSGYGLSYELLRDLEKSGLSAICISLNGTSIDIDKKSRDTYQYGINAVNLLKGSYIKTYINYVINNSNLNDINNIYRYAKENKIDGINLLKSFPSFNQSYFYHNKKLTQAQIKTLDKVVSKDKDFFNIDKCLLEYWEYKSSCKLKCEEAGKSTYFIDVDGSIHPCSMCLKNVYNDINELEKLPFYNRCLAMDTI